MALLGGVGHPVCFLVVYGIIRGSRSSCLFYCCLGHYWGESVILSVFLLSRALLGGVGHPVCFLVVYGIIGGVGHPVCLHVV